MEGLICDKISKMFMVEFRGWYMDVHCKMYSFCTCDIFHNIFFKTHSGCYLENILEGGKGGSWEMRVGPFSRTLAVRGGALDRGEHSQSMNSKKFVGKGS